MSFVNWEGGVNLSSHKKKDQERPPARFDDETTYKQDFNGTQDKQGNLNDSKKRNELKDMMR